MKNQRGITLIALIITIIILLILAMVSIKLVINDGIITHAETATAQYKEEQIREDLALLHTEYKMAILQGTNVETAKNDLLAKINARDWCNSATLNADSTEIAAVAKNEKTYTLNLDTGRIEDNGVTDGGETTTWTQTGKTVTNGTKTLNVGAIVGKDVIINEKLPTLSDGNTWAILGAENGKLLLVTTKNISKGGIVQKASFDGDSDIYKTEKIDETTDTTVIDMTKIKLTFDAVIDNCGIVTEDTVAENVRSINVEDINRVTGYNPMRTGIAYDEGPFGADSSLEYGNIVTYEANKAIVATNKATGYTSSLCRKPRESSNSVITVKSDYYYYYPETLTVSEGTKPTEEWYKVLFENTGSADTYYWLESGIVGSTSSWVCWGLNYVRDTAIMSGTLWDSWQRFIFMELWS